MLWWILLLVALGGIAAAPFWVEKHRPVMGRDARKKMGGEYLKLSQGVTRYRWLGAARGKVLVAVHGLTTPSQIFDALAPLLGALGYRVLTYDLYGRGGSDTPAGDQNAAYFTRQLNDLLEALKVEGPVSVMGYSMGGSIATAFAQEAPERIERLVLLAPAGLEIKLSRYEQFCVNTPFVGDWLLLASGMGPQATTRWGRLWRGFLPSVLSSLRHTLRADQADAHRAIGRADVPVVAIWGGQDQRIPLRGLGRLAQANRNAQQHVVDLADHSLPQSAAQDVAELLAATLVDRT